MPRIATDIVQFKGLRNLDEEEKAFLDKIVPEYYEKIKRYIHNLAKVEVHFKKMRSTGERALFDINVKVASPERKTFVGTNSKQNRFEGWRFSKALHGAFKDVENQIKKELKKDQSHPRPRD